MIQKFTIILFAAFLTTTALAVPEEPHRIFGEVTDAETGETLEVDITVEHEGDQIKSFETNENGYYDVEIPNGEHENEQIDILIQDEETESFTFEALGSTEINIEHTEETEDENEEEQEDETNGEETDDNGDGGIGGGGGAPPIDEENDEEDEQEEMDEEETETEVEETQEEDVEQETEEQNESEITVTEEIQNLDEGEEVELQLESTSEDTETETDASGSVSSVSFTSSSEADNTEIEVTETSDDIVESSEEIETRPEGEILGYTTVETNIDTENAKFQFQINQEQLENRNAEPNQVTKQRHNQGEWEDLQTQHIETENQTHIFEADSPEGFSTFATTIKTNEEETTETITGQFTTSPTPTTITILILLTIGAAALIWRQKQ